MAEHFRHERLKVYQKGMPFASMRKTLLDDLSGENWGRGKLGTGK